MCGISGVIAFNEQGKSSLPKIHDAVACLAKRGPDSNGVYTDKNVALGHNRLSIIDTSAAALQPMSDLTGRYTIVFNGEFFNFREHRDFLISKGIQLRSESDTEVLLYLYILEGERCLERVNGFFAFAIYDKEEETVFIARDRMGIKPLLYFRDANRFVFASEMKALMSLGIPKELDEASMLIYFQLNYIAGPASIFKGVYKLEPGHFIHLNIRHPEKTRQQCYYKIPFPDESTLAISASLSYSQQEQRLRQLMDESVKRRMISDVPLGAFLSGGIDSSIIVSLAAKHTNHLRTFSIGFRDEPMFDETEYANLVAKKCNTDHTVFKLRNDDLFQHLYDALDYIDEPFADSSALNVYILSKETRKHVTVALSGDGADELFGGYNKHEAERRARAGGLTNTLLRSTSSLLKLLPQSRNSKSTDLFRRANRMAEGLNLSTSERYWRWAAFENEEEVSNLMRSGTLSNEYKSRKKEILKYIGKTSDIQDVLYTDMHLVLVNDMLTKVDMMSMANSLEVRVPFLDYTVVDFAFTLPITSKIDANGRKKIIRDAFRNDLPPELYTRKKKGFEVPLLKWFRNELKSLIEDDLLSQSFIEEQALFNYTEIENLKTKLFSLNPGDAHAKIWALLVFQYWWKKWMK
ncbi:MAG: asparagine synthase (glutamine-hydrolyzing) [Bacteroidetes bacterium]|nr:asparagine synthase (glutamine-hydrolyzing) [Bacteroidota bacterium]